MKSTLSFAVIALIGNVSAVTLKNTISSDKHFQEFHVDNNGFIVLGEETMIRKSHKSKRESDNLANGDKDDDKEVESEMGDGEDEIVNDHGFGLSGGNWANNAHK